MGARIRLYIQNSTLLYTSYVTFKQVPLISLCLFSHLQTGDKRTSI